MVREGYWYGLPLALIAAGALLFNVYLAAFFFILTLLVLNFFRDPDRPLPDDPAAIVSPADGKVVQIALEQAGGRSMRRISIFMSPLDVHVNRAPAEGTLREVVYRKGSFHVASEERASSQNEQNVFTLDTAAGPMMVKQIAGLVARRIVFWKRVGDRLQRGERVGLIKFGSRVDVLLDPAIEVLVKVGDRVQAGSSTLARMPGPAAGLETLKTASKA
jgi:phosphatidylserine decarboxylase